MQTVRLIKIFAIAIIKLPERINSTVSALKVEKVLNPPQKPIKTNILKLWFVINFSLNTAIVIARIKQLKILEHSVARGKTDLKFDCTNAPIPKRARLPKPPPININSKLFMSLIQFQQI